MLGELPKLFGKAFVIGYVLPALLTLAALALIGDVFDDKHWLKTQLHDLLTPNKDLPTVELGLIVIVVWLFAVLLMVLNLVIIRVLEGYYPWNPALLFRWRCRHLFNKLTAELGTLESVEDDDDDDDEGKARTKKLLARRSGIRLRLSNEFPEDVDLVLATRFGNTLRAFERYPQIVYGLEPMRGWTLLQNVIPETYADALDDAKSQLDFWVNIWFGGLLAALAYVVLYIDSGAHPAVYIPFVCVAIAVAAAMCARGAGSWWGDLVKGAFHLYRGALCEQLGLEMPRTMEREFEMWDAVSQTIVFRRASDALALTPFRPTRRPSAAGKKSA